MIDGAKLAFLESVLGVGGAAALSKAVSKAPQIENVLLPRTIIAWLTVAGQIEYNGSIPGVGQSRMSLTKTDSGWDGSIEISGSEYQLNGADLCKVGAHIAVAIGADEDIDPSVKTVDIAKLGKTIDLLIKARAVQGLAKGWPKDEKENQENLEAHAVFSDLAEEKGKVVREPKKGDYGWRTGFDPARGQLGDMFEAAAPGEWSWRVNSTHAILGRNIEGTHYAISGVSGHQGVKEGRPLFTPGATWKVQVEDTVSYRYPRTFVANSHHHVRAIGDALAQHLQSGKTLESFDAKSIPASQPVSDEYEAKFGLAKGWPKDEKENQENLEAHAVFSDLAEEKGKPVEVPQDFEYDWTKDLDTGNTGWVMRNDGNDSVFLKKVITERPGSPEKTSSAWIQATAPGRINNDGVPVVTGKWLVLHGGVEENGRSYHLAYAPLVVDTHHHVRAIGDALEQHYLSGGRAQDFIPGEALERHYLGVPAQAEPSWYRVQDAKKPSATATTYEAKFGTKKAEASGRGAHERAGTPETLKPDGPIPQAGPAKQQGIPKQNMPRPTGHNPVGPTAKSERSAKISKAQSQRKCHICGVTHLSNGSFVGCKCLTNLAKNISSVSDNKGGFVVTMQSMSLEDIVFVLDTLRGE